MKTIDFTLRVEIEGLHEDEAAAGGPSAGEALKNLKHEIETMSFTAASTTVRVAELQEVKKWEI